MFGWLCRFFHLHYGLNENIDLFNVFVCFFNYGLSLFLSQPVISEFLKGLDTISD